jgi:hypothetical protein
VLHRAFRESVEAAFALRHFDGVANSRRVNRAQKSEQIVR